MVLNAADVLGPDFFKDVYSNHFETLISSIEGNISLTAVPAAKIILKITEHIEVMTIIIFP